MASNTNSEANIDGIEEVSSNREESDMDYLSPEESKGATTNSTLVQALKLGFKAALLIEDWELAEDYLLKIQTNDCERAIYEVVRHDNLALLENFVENLEICEILAKEMLDRGEVEQAATYAHLALEISENSFAGWNVLGKVFDQTGERMEALRCFLRATEAIRVDFSIIPIYL